MNERIKAVAESHFYLDEFVPKEIWEQFEANARWFVSPLQLRMAEFVRKYFGKPVTINNWWEGGTLDYCGYRPPDCAVGAKFSQHKLMTAIDCHIAGVTDYDAIRQQVLHRGDRFLDAGITTIEEGTNGWLHVDGRWTGLDRILVVPFQ